MKFRALIGLQLIVLAMTLHIGSASAQTISASQTITITARVAPMRSIVVNEQGRMVKIYSNTSEALAPKVFINEVPGVQVGLTDQLLQQYNSIINKQKNLVGVEIPVEPQRGSDDSVRNLLVNSMSTLTQQFKLFI